jgi:hypothetical protein
MKHSILALLIALALIAASCGDDSNGTSGEAEVESAPLEDDSTDEDSPSKDSPSEDSPSPVDDGPEDVVLTDTFRGVTADTITLGYTSIDFELLNESFGLDLAFQNFGPQADAIVAYYNENGGVLGRQIELIHEKYLPVGPTSADEVCLKLTEDATIFAVLAGFSGPGALDVNSCFTELHDTILVGPAPRSDQAGGLWVSADMSLNRRNSAVARLMADAGVLDGLGEMMVIGSSIDEQPLVDGMAEALSGVGVGVPITEVITTTGDRPATANDVAVWLERARSSGVSTAVLLGEDEFRNQEFFIQAPEFTFIMGNGDSITDWSSIPPEGLEEGTRLLTNNNGPDVAAFDDPQILTCVAAVEEAQGIEVRATSQLPNGEPNYFSGTVGACRSISLFVQIATAAGPNLTNETWLAALDNVPDLSLPGYKFATIRADKVDARDQLVLVEYDRANLTFVPISDAIDVG